MELTNMKLPTKSEAAAVQEIEVDVPEYPYGLKLHFNDDSLKLLPSLKLLAIGEEVKIQAIAVVTGLRQDLDQHNDDMSADVQITDIACEPVEAKNPEELSPREYRLARKGKLF